MTLEKGQVYQFANKNNKEAFLKIMEVKEQEAVAVQVSRVNVITWGNIEDDSSHLFYMDDPCTRIIINEESIELFLAKSKLIK